MQQRVITIVLLIGLCLGLSLLASAMATWRMPDNQQGYSPKQPIAYSHRLHAGELQIDCQFCHTSADVSRHAGIPSSDVCMKCHRYVTAGFDATQHEMKLADTESRKAKVVVSEELQKLYDALALDKDFKPVADAKPTSIPWVRVHNLPDFASFNHQAHVGAGVACQKCHGAIESMERVEQHATLSMGWCVNCHREVNSEGLNGQEVHASTDCTACHH